MKYEEPQNIEIGELPEIAVPKKRGLSIVWIIPIVAALVGGWLTLQNHFRKRPYHPPLLSMMGLGWKWVKPKLNINLLRWEQSKVWI